MPDATLIDMYEAKAAAYARFGTGKIAAHAERLLPPGGSVLDLGCASGGLLEILRPRARHLAGLELSPSAARTAAGIGDHIVQGALEDRDLPFASDAFDLVVLADVLEHLVDPASALERAVGWCRPGGHVLLSTPNVAHWAARAELLRGRWPSEETGTFDAGHLHFFTQESLAALCRRAGLEDLELDVVVPALRNHLPVDRLRPRRAARRLERWWQAVGRRLPGLLGYQLVVAASRPAGEVGRSERQEARASDRR